MKQKSFSRLSKSPQSRHVTFFILFSLLLAVVLFAGSTLAAPVSSPAFAPTLVTTAVSTVIPVTATAVPLEEPDLGDAPDSTNHFGALMRAYPGVIARFPTVFDPATGLPQGPKHLNQPLRYHLGPGISIEQEADIGFDADGINNIVPLADNPNNDGFDDGVTLPNTFAHCQLTNITYRVTVVGGAATTAYFNLFLDWNRNGSWGDTPPCLFSAAPEWAVQNQAINLPGPGTYTFTTPTFLTHNATPGKALWIRATLSEIPATAADGSGPGTGYRFGETEDYKLPGLTVTAVPTFEATIVPHD